MIKQSKQIYQFKITLEYSEPPIWRCIQVPDTYSFWDFHVAIQDSMGWGDDHLHQFEMKNPHGKNRIVISNPDDAFGESVLIEWETFIADYFSLKNKKALYVYDFGDNWRHQVHLEKIIPVEEKQKYPKCIAGERACPPEDCGGIYGYQKLIDIMNDPKHEEYESMLDWLGEKLKPDLFNIKDICFSSPSSD